MKAMDPKQLIPMLNPNMSKQHRRSLLSPSQLQLARQLDGHTNLGAISSVLGRPLRTTIKHIKQMAFLDVVHLYAPTSEGQKHLSTDDWVDIINTPLVENQGTPSQPSFQIPKSDPSIPDLQSWTSGEHGASEEAQLPEDDFATAEEIRSIHAAPEPQVPLPKDTPAEGSAKHSPGRIVQRDGSASFVLDLTDDMAIQGTELELPMEENTAPPSAGFTVMNTPPRFTSLSKIKEMEWTNEHHIVAESPTPPQPQSKSARRLTPTEEELQLLLADFAKREKSKRAEKGLYHYSSRSQMDLPQATTPPPPSNSGGYRAPTSTRRNPKKK